MDGTDAHSFAEKMPGLRSALGWIGSGIEFACSALLDLCFPAVCAGCRRVGGGQQRSWCGACRGKLPWVMSPLCPGCGTPFKDSPRSLDHLCGECIDSAFHFDTARSAVLHEGIVRTRIHQFKFGGQLRWAPSLVELMEAAYADWGLPAPDLIVPVPLHPKRLAQRGFNQSGLLASRFARRTRVPVSFGVLVRKNRTDPQTSLRREERLKNVKGAFEVSGAKKVRGRRILLIDDVFTTGTTLSECAKSLKRNGAASEVHALTVSRALPD